MAEPEYIFAEELSRTDEKVVHRVFDRLAGRHTGGSADLQILDYDPDKYPEQRLDIVGVKGHRVDIETVRALGRAAYPHFDDVEAKFREREDLLNNVVIDVLKGRSVLFLTDHGTIINTPVGGAGFYCALSDFASKELYSDISHIPADMIISKLISRYKALGMPATSILTSIWDLYFSIPPSDTIRNSAIPESTRKAINQAMLMRYQKEAAQDDNFAVGTIHKAAGSGSRDVEEKVGLIGLRHKRVHMGPLAHGTVELMSRSRILDTGVILDEKEPVVTIGHLRNPVNSPEEAHGVMGRIATRNSEATGNEYIYHPTRESFRSAIAHVRNR